MIARQEKPCEICKKSFVLTMKTERYCAACRQYKNVHKSNMNWLKPRKRQKSSLVANTIAFLFEKPKRKSLNNINKG